MQNHRLISRGLALAALLLAGPAVGASPPPAASLPVAANLSSSFPALAGPGEVQTSYGLVEERLRLRPELAERLLALGVDRALRVDGWPVAPAARASVALLRVEPYSPEARIYRVDEHGMVELPRATLRVFRGRADDAAGAEVLVTLDPESGELRGVVRGAEDEFWTLDPVGDLAGTHRLSSPDRLAKSLGSAPEWSCGAAEGPADLAALGLAGDGGAMDAADAEPLAAATAFGAEALAELAEPQALPFSSLRSATIAVDTDNELMQQKFSNSTTAATNYLVSLFATMNIVYERDLRVRLLQGTTYLRTGADPWVKSTTYDQLMEFGSYWQANHAGVPRALAMLLSGKATSAYGSAGIAWLRGLCSKSTGYSVSQVFKYPGSTGASDGMVVPHELGHNFGAPHTHCERTPSGGFVDTCYSNGGTGCYVGGATCPAPTTVNGVTSVRGTLMSYCHLLGGCSASRVFHPTTITNFSTYVQGASCLPLAAVPLLVDGFDDGNFSPWVRRP